MVYWWRWKNLSLFYHGLLYTKNLNILVDPGALCDAAAGNNSFLHRMFFLIHGCAVFCDPGWRGER